MTSNPWGQIVKMAGVFLLLQPVVAVIALAAAASLGLGPILISIAFIPVALLGCNVGFGLIASRPWARSRLAIWAPLHVLLIPAVLWVVSTPVTKGVLTAVVDGILLYGLYQVTCVTPEQPLPEAGERGDRARIPPSGPTTPCSGRRSRVRRDLEWSGEGCAPAAADGGRYAH